MVTLDSLLRKENGRLLENQKEEMIISQKSASNIPEKRNKMCGWGLGRIKYTAEIWTCHIWERVSIKVPTIELRRKCVGRKAKENKTEFTSADEKFTSVDEKLLTKEKRKLP